MCDHNICVCESVTAKLRKENEELRKIKTAAEAWLKCERKEWSEWGSQKEHAHPENFEAILAGRGPK